MSPKTKIQPALNLPQRGQSIFAAAIVSSCRSLFVQTNGTSICIHQFTSVLVVETKLHLGCFLVQEASCKDGQFQFQFHQQAAFRVRAQQKNLHRVFVVRRQLDAQAARVVQSGRFVRCNPARFPDRCSNIQKLQRKLDRREKVLPAAQVLSANASQNRFIKVGSINFSKTAPVTSKSA